LKFVVIKPQLLTNKTLSAFSKYYLAVCFLFFLRSARRGEELMDSLMLFRLKMLAEGVPTGEPIGAEDWIPILRLSSFMAVAAAVEGLPLLKLRRSMLM